MHPVSNLTDTQFVIEEQFFHPFDPLLNGIFFNTDPLKLGEQLAEKTIFAVTLVLQIFGQVLPVLQIRIAHIPDHSQTDLFHHPHPPVVDHLKTDRLQLFPNALELFRRQGSGKCDHTQFHFQRQNAFFPENVRNGHYTPAAYHILYINCRFHDPYAKIVNVSQVNSFPSRFLVPVSPDSACFKQP